VNLRDLERAAHDPRDVSAQVRLWAARSRLRWPKVGQDPRTVIVSPTAHEVRLLRAFRVVRYYSDWRDWHDDTIDLNGLPHLVIHGEIVVNLPEEDCKKVLEAFSAWRAQWPR